MSLFLLDEAVPSPSDINLVRRKGNDSISSVFHCSNTEKEILHLSVFFHVLIQGNFCLHLKKVRKYLR